MLCSLKWLSEFVDLVVAPAELAERLSLAGLEAKARRRFEVRPDGVVAARLVEVRPHPQADRLTVCRVETGAGEVEVVCGAPNARPGLMTFLALPGARLAQGLKIAKSRIRGVESGGMLCAEDELGLSEDHSGIIELDPATVPGLSLPELVDLDDHILGVDLTPNRGDCASVIGLAREVAALTGQRLKPLDVSYPESGRPAAELARVDILDPDLCPRYAATLLSGLKAARSPWPIRDKVLSGGMRPLTNLVDVTNLVMLELGQPLHAFDFAQVAQSRIVVRRARPGEPFTTLDNQERRLTEGMLLICDGERPVGLAGVMGGLNSEIRPETTQVLIEAAVFDPLNNRRTATRLGLQTEASYRFQRGVDPIGVITALKRATALMAQLGGGAVHPGLIDVHPRPYEPRRLTLRVGRTNAFLGLSLTAARMAELLNSIQVKAEVRDAGMVEAVVPPWRAQDLTREVDLTEEVARLHGFDQVPATHPPAHEPAAPPPPLVALKERLRPLLASLGLTEIITYSFIPGQAPDLLGFAPDDPRRAQVPLLNALSEDQAVLRTSLLHGLLVTLARNLRHGAEAVRLFEWGVVFEPRGEGQLPAEETRLAGLLCGPREPVSWAGSREKVDFYDLKGQVEAILEGLRLGPARFVPAAAGEYEPGQAAEVLIGEAVVGRLGQIAAATLERFDLKTPAWAFDLSADRLQDLVAQVKPGYKPAPRHPSMTRDVALVVRKALPAGRLLELVAELEEPLLTEVVLFDLYEGRPLAEHEKNIGLRLRYQALDHTLTEDEIAPVHQRLTGHLLAQTGGWLRQ